MGAGHHSPSAKICVIRGSNNFHLTVPYICTIINVVNKHFGPRSTDPGNLLSQHLARGIRTNTLKAITDRIKVSETIVDRVGGYNFLPALIASGSTRRQCPLYSVNSESSLLGCERSACRRLGWSLRMFQTQQYEPHGSTRVVEGQPDGRGRATRQSLFIARDRLRCEPGSKPVIVTAPFTGCEGHVPSRGDKGRRRKIFVGCPAFLSFWDQSPLRYALRSETVGNRLYPLHGQTSLCRFTAEAQIQDRSRAKTGPNTAPGFLRVSNPTPQQRVPSPASNHPSPSQGEIKRGSRVKGGAGPPVIPADAGASAGGTSNQRK